jgi:hypothetical protein
MRKAILLISLMLLASSAVADEARKPHELFDDGWEWLLRDAPEAAASIGDRRDDDRLSDRYITWPGQALGYKIGELKIKEPRAKAQRELGPKFDVRAFHDTVLGAGPLPLSLPETRVNAWIGAQGGAR